MLWRRVPALNESERFDLLSHHSGFPRFGGNLLSIHYNYLSFLSPDLSSISCVPSLDLTSLPECLRPPPTESTTSAEQKRSDPYL